MAHALHRQADPERTGEWGRAEPERVLHTGLTVTGALLSWEGLRGRRDGTLGWLALHSSLLEPWLWGGRVTKYRIALLAAVFRASWFFWGDLGSGHSPWSPDRFLSCAREWAWDVTGSLAPLLCAHSGLHISSSCLLRHRVDRSFSIPNTQLFSNFWNCQRSWVIEPV